MTLPQASEAARVEAMTELDAWHSIFGTTQLTHAKARLDASEAERDWESLENTRLRSLLSDDLGDTYYAVGVALGLSEFNWRTERCHNDWNDEKMSILE